MAIRNPVLFGLNVNNNFTDVLSRNECLENLGLNSSDLEVIRGISGTSLTKIDLQNVSGLNVNLTRYLSRLKSDTSLYAGVIEKVGGYQSVLQGNFEANGAISGGAIKFKYISNNSGSGLTEDDIKFGDISTSRVSSWSSASTDPNATDQAISYGGSVQVKGTVKIGQKNNPVYQPDSLESIINVLDIPEPIRFPTEVPTDVLEIKINDQTRYVYAMRGIPIVFLTAFKRLKVEMGIIPISGGNPTYTILDTDPDGVEIQTTPSLISGTTSILVFNSSSFKERELKIYFPPNNIEILSIPSLNIVELPPIKFLNLTNINLSKNNIQTIPDFNKLNYIFDGSSPPTATLSIINLRQNPLSLSDIDEYSRWGTYAVKRLPKTLTSLDINGTYTGEQDWQNVENFVVIRASQSEFNAIVCDPVTTQTNSFTFDLQNGTTQVTEIEGIFFDKIVFSEDQITYNYVYVENPTTTGNEPNVGADWEQFIKTRYNGSSKKLDVLDISTRCPNLKTYNHVEISGRRIFKTPLSKYPNLVDNELFDYVSDVQEYTPRVELRTIETYNLVDNRFTKLNPIFKTPSNYLGANETSSLRVFNVNSNGRALTEPDGTIDFSVMNDIRNININLTNLSIPIGLSGKQEFRTFSAYRTNFPSRPTGTNVPNVYNEQHPDGGYINGATGDGNPSNANNALFGAKYPTSGENYIFNNCEKLSTLSAPYSNIDGMIPKFAGNNVLRNLDLRSTYIEGGRPPMPSNNGISGRRFVAWDDTFADCVNTLVNLRIFGPNIGRNIGIYDPISKEYTAAAFQGSTFNLPFLQRLDIISTGEYLRGEFFSLSGLSSLRFLNSYSSGWGKDIPNGTPLPSFQGANLLQEVRLYNNNFSGEINLKNLPSLTKIILRQNNLSTFGDYEGLNNLIILSVSNNANLTGNLPNFSTGSPNIRTISLNGCNLNSYIQGSIADLFKLRSIDLANNSFNSSSIDTILNDCLVNYSNFPRTGVVVNLSGNASPSRTEITIPTSSTQTNSYVINVQQPSPTTSQLFTFFTRGSNGLASQGPDQLDLKDGIDPNNDNISYTTKIFQNGDDITSNVTINFINNTITFPVSGGSPISGTEINFVVETTVIGSRVEVTGGVVTVNTLRSLGWIITIGD